MLKVKPSLVALSVLALVAVLPVSSSMAAGGVVSTELNNSTVSFGSDAIGASPNARSGHDGVFLPTRERANASSIYAKTNASTTGGRGAVTYHAPGTIIENPNSYLIWYGNWDANSCNAPSGTNSTASIIKDLVSNIGGTPWNAINATYYQIINGKKTYVSNSITYAGCAFDSGSQGLSLDAPGGPKVSDVVKHAISQGQLPNDVNGVYMVLSASNVSVNGFLTTFCGYHSAFINNNSIIKYAFVGDPTASLGSCISQLAASPNGNVLADGMASVVAHELVEPISDPQGYSWFDQVGFENADKCAWTYGDVVKAADGSFSNMTIGSRKYLIQQNVAANSNLCISALKPNGR
jgi:hypothetical protein